jgi:hypothetical protein
MRPSLRAGGRVCERRQAERAGGLDDLTPKTAELAPPPSTNARNRSLSPATERQKLAIIASGIAHVCGNRLCKTKNRKNGIGSQDRWTT